ncbi:MULTISPECIES: hypothetical protein [unclassified Marinobacter]|jgi:hypothetical protein|uniref:hypothetical protein n=1 Tax=Marinobacter TaxID=2742 RepID=UPI000C573A23|nr:MULTISPECIES: hypothetical protein [unclassified Marinobacter]MAK51125.1 hypothetical protein [Marinobacter sp.]MAM51557.1 hypothetical protein [Marinobacter sp.]|tara:strand:+ start:2492 stop:3385 length:894 start_codon:yes stop_codon:yes gene_type:complete
MAENQSKAATRANSPAQAPVLRPGRAADPVPVPVAPGDQTPATVPANPAAESAPTGQAPETSSESEPSADRGESRDTDSGKPERVLAESRQRKLRLMLRQCDRVLLMDFDLLAMNGWPDNYTMAEARRSRDLWLFSALIAAAVFLSGLTGFVPAWIAGGGFGAFVIILLLGVPAVRRIYTTKPSYLDLIITRQRMLREARQHVAHLEGSDGLIWQCARMADFNPALKNTRFSHLLRLSESRSLSRQLTRREHVRLYLICLLEAEKAYSRVQKAFFEGNQEALDRGWEEVAAEPEPRT